MRRLLVLLLLLVVHAGTWAASVVVAETRPACGKNPYRVAIWDSGSLYSFKTHAGFDKEFIEALSQRSGCRFELVEQPFVRMVSEVERGTVDIGTSARSSPEREQFAWFANYLASRMYAIVHRDARISGLDEFLARSDLTASTIRGTQTPGYAQYVSALRDLGRIDESLDVDMLVRKLGTGRVQAIFCFALMCRAPLAAQGLDKQVQILDWAPKEALAFAGLMFSKKVFSEAEVSRWQQLIGVMRRDGTLAGIAKRYFSHQDVKELLRLK